MEIFMTTEDLKEALDRVRLLERWKEQM